MADKACQIGDDSGIMRVDCRACAYHRWSSVLLGFIRELTDGRPARRPLFSSASVQMRTPAIGAESLCEFEAHWPTAWLGRAVPRSAFSVHSHQNPYAESK